MNFSVFALTFTFLFSFSNQIFGQTKTYADLSRRLINAVRYDKNVDAMLDSLANVSPDFLAKELNDDAAKKAFWINVYNGYIQLILTESPEKFEENRSQFFQEPQFTVAGQKLSFEDVEHGIIRRSKARLGLGIFPKLFPGKFERRMRTKEVDPRIHFALNCGAKSCPPVAAYDYRRVEEQLAMMSVRHLEKHARYDGEKNVVYVPKLLQWFSGDFGICKKKKRKFLVKHQAIPEDSKPDIKFDEYDWTLFLDNFVEV